MLLIVSIFFVKKFDFCWISAYKNDVIAENEQNINNDEDRGYIDREFEFQIFNWMLCFVYLSYMKNFIDIKMCDSYDMKN